MWMHVFHMFMILRKIYECKAFLVAQMVKNVPMMQETCVWSLGQKDPLEEKMTTILAWKIPVFSPGKSHGQRSLAGYSTQGCEEWDTTELLTLS